MANRFENVDLGGKSPAQQMMIFRKSLADQIVEVLKAWDISREAPIQTLLDALVDEKRT
jgi:hypothetical protein